MELKQQIIDALGRLNKSQQEQLLDYVKSLLRVRSKSSRIRELAGSINKEDLDLMEKAIEKDCEKINQDEW